MTRQQAGIPTQPEGTPILTMPRTTEPTEGVATSEQMSPSTRKRQANMPNDGTFLPENVDSNRDESGDRDDHNGTKPRAGKKRKTKPSTLDRRTEVSPEDDPSDSNSVTKKPNTSKEADVKEFSDEMVEVFPVGVKVITDWTSEVVDDRYVQLCRWYDVEGISMKQCGVRWVEEGCADMKQRKNSPEFVSESGMWKHYNTHGKRFYEEKGLTFIPTSVRKAYNKRNGVINHSKNTVPYGENRVPEAVAEEMDPVPSLLEMPRGHEELRHEQDEKLVQLLSKKVKTYGLTFDFEKRGQNFDDFVATQSKINGSDLETETTEVIRFRNGQASGDNLSFKRKADNARRGHSTRPVLSRKLAVEHCALVRDAIKQDSTFDTIEYGESIADITVTRFVACISPFVRSTLPTHDVAEVLNAQNREFRATKIDWSMQELEDLYMFACTIRAVDVCDMVIDRVHQELHDPEKRLIRTADGTVIKFSILYMRPAFINLLEKKDEKGFDFFTDALAMNAEHTLELLNTSGLDSWNQQVKNVLIGKLESGVSSEASKNESDAVCSRYHHHESSEKACYRSKVPTAPLVLVSNVAQQTGSAPRISKKRLEADRRKNRGKDEKNKAWKLQRERYDDPEEHVETSDSSYSSDGEDCHTITVNLPKVYTRARDLFRSSDRGYGVPFEYTERASEATWARLAAQDRDGSNYSGGGMDLLKDTAGMQRKKVMIVLKKLRMFRDSGYDPDDIEASEGPSDMSQMSDEDFEMMDADESGYDD